MTQSQSIMPMEAENVSHPPHGKHWRYEPKWDGFRCLAFKHGEEVLLQSKSGKHLERYFPDVVTMLAQLKAKDCILDGELLIKTEKGFSFSELQLRLHPAESRVRKLAAEHPASYVLFDILLDDKGVNLMPLPFAARRKE